MTGLAAQEMIMAQAQTGEQDAPASDGHAAPTGDAPAAPAADSHGAEGVAVDAHGAAEHGSGIDPVHQFEIKRFIDFRDCYDPTGAICTKPEHFDHSLDFLSFTNSSLFMIIAVGLIVGFLVYAMRAGSLIPSRIQSVAEISYEFVAKIVRENSGEEGMKFFPFVFTLFAFILTLNMLGMIPYSFTVTSHIIVTFALALMVFLVVTVVGFIKNGPGFLKLFVPSGAPVALLPLLVVIEAISYLIRPISLSVRLFANMMAGHMMLKVFASFVVALGVVGGWAPLLFMVPFTGLEILVAFLQAFVFAVLTCIYLNDALHMHH
jgi:F-type H+-transporting ATPase subunit a